MKKFYITTPIYYVNDKPHIGHAYTSIAADFIARFKRLDGYQVFFLTGTDEYGAKIAKSAANANISPQEFVDQFSATFRKLAVALNISHDDFIRTTEPRHTEYAQHIWQKLEKNGYIYLSTYSGWYAMRDEAFYTEAELVDGKAPTGAEVEWLEEESYFFKLSALQDLLLEFYENNPNFINPESKRNEVISFVKSGLRDLSISRTTSSWGIPISGNNKHVMYVWLDALCNYLSALGENLESFWPCDLHLVGKDILRFHAVYWPAFLIAADIAPPQAVFAHGWWTNAGVKISKSLGNTIDPLQLIEKFGLDYVRYFLMRFIPFGNDGNYYESNLIQLVNAELANNIGNLIQRTLSFINKHCDNTVCIPDALEKADYGLLNFALGAHTQCQNFITNQEIHKVIGVVVELASSANAYIDSEAPWNLKKSNIKRMKTILYVLFEAIRVIAILLQPIVPESASKILDLLNVSKRTLQSSKERITRDMTIKTAAVIFPKIL